MVIILLFILFIYWKSSHPSLPFFFHLHSRGTKSTFSMALRTTQHLLMYSGFVPATNTHNNVHIKLDLPQSDPESLRGLKQGLLGSVLGLGPSPSGWWLPIDQNGNLDERLGVPFLRICCLSMEEYEREQKNTSFSSLVSLKNEVAGCQMLVDIVAAVLEKFSTKGRMMRNLQRRLGPRGRIMVGVGYFVSN